MVTTLNPLEAFVRGLFNALGSLAIIVICLALWAIVTTIVCFYFSFMPGMLISEMPAPWNWASAFIIMMLAFLVVNAVNNHNAKKTANGVTQEILDSIPRWIAPVFIGISLAAIEVSLLIYMIGDYEYGEVPGNLRWDHLPSLLIAQAVAFVLGIVYLRSEAKRRSEQQD